MERVEKANELLEQCEKDAIRLQQINEELKAIENRRLALERYYNHDYMEDYKKYENEKRAPRVTDQDSIWNVLADQNFEKLSILKAIANSL